MTDKWVVLETYDTAVEAHLHKAVLEAADIPVLLNDSMMVTMHSPGIGGVKLLVPKDRLSQALFLLHGEKGKDGVIPFPLR